VTAEDVVGILVLVPLALLMLAALLFPERF